MKLWLRIWFIIIGLTQVVYFITPQKYAHGGISLVKDVIVNVLQYPDWCHESFNSYSCFGAWIVILFFILGLITLWAGIFNKLNKLTFVCFVLSGIPVYWWLVIDLFGWQKSLFMK